MNQLIEEWRTIREFPGYEISNRGNIYNNRRRQMMRTSQNNFGHTKITLTDYDGRRYDRSVALLVAETFVEAPNLFCDHVMVLDGDLSNVRADNLVWRPRGFVWKYAQQLKRCQPLHFQNLSVRNVVTGAEYQSIMEAGMKEGLLFRDIWQSTYKGSEVYPNGSIFEISQRI